MTRAQSLIPSENLGEHLALALSHARNVAPRLHSRNDNSGTPLANPESGSGGLGHLTTNIIHANEIGLDNLLPKDTHDVSITLTSKFYGRSKVFHNDNSDTKIINSSHNG